MVKFIKCWTRLGDRMKYVIREDDIKYVVIEKAFGRAGWRRRGFIPKKVQVQPVAGKPYLAIRWTGRAATAQLGAGQEGHELKQLVRELPTHEDRQYLEFYIRYKYGQNKYRPHYPKGADRDHMAILKTYAKQVDDIIRRVPKHVDLFGKEILPGLAKEKLKAPTHLTLKDTKGAPIEPVATAPIRHPARGSIEIAEYLQKWVAGKPGVTWDQAMARAKLKYPGQGEGRYERALTRAGWIKPIPPPPPPTEVKTGDISAHVMADYLMRKINLGKYNDWNKAIKRLKEVYPGQPDDRYEAAAERAGLDKPRAVERLTPEQKKAILELASVQGGWHKKYFLEGIAASVIPLGGGCNHTFTMKIQGNGQGCWKPLDGEKLGLRGEIKGAYYKREAAAYSVAKSLGLDDLVPETYIRDDPEHGVGSLQAWVWNGRAGALDSNQYPEDVVRAGFLDFIIENSDRHGGNYFVTDGGKIQLIDNGLSFSDKTRANLAHGNVRMCNEAAKDKVPVELMQKAVDTVDEVSENLRKLGLEDKAIKFYRERIDVVREHIKSGKVTVWDLVKEWGKN
jgi:hypothetical protein